MALYRIDSWLFGLILVTSTLFLATGVSSIVAYGAIGFVLFVVCAWTLTQHRLALTTPTYLLVGFAIVWGVYLVHVIIDPRGGTALPGTLVFIGISAIAVFWFPQTFDRDAVFQSITRISAFAILIGLPVIIAPLGPKVIAAGPLTITHAPHAYFQTQIAGTWLRVYPLQSYFTNQNFASVLFLAGAVSALTEVRHGLPTRTRYIGATLLAINSAGVVLAHSRSAMVALATVLMVYIVAEYGSIAATQTLVFVGVCGGVIAGLMTLGILPGPNIITKLNLTGRLSLWRATLQVTAERPLLGYGQISPVPFIADVIVGYEAKVPHNAYLRILFQTGLIGGLAHLFVIVRVLLSNFRALRWTDAIVPFCLMIAIAIIMMFENFSLFGINSSNILAAITLGYSARVALSLNSGTDTDESATTPLSTGSTMDD